MIRKIAGRKRIFLLAAVGSLLFILSIISYLYLSAEQIQQRIKERICNKVIAHEDELSEIVKEVPLEEGLSYFKGTNTDSSIQWVYYKELDDERIDKVFKDFHLSHIYKNIDESIEFVVKPTVISALWNGYMYGFYYSENDEPVNVVWGDDMEEKEENEFEAVTVGWGEYWYRTEKITDNWWFYETKTLWVPASRYE